MYQAPAGPQPIGGVLDHGFALYRASFKDAFVLAFGGALLAAPMNRMAGPIAEGAVPGVAVILAVLGVILVGCVSLGAIIASMHAVMQGTRLALGEAVAVGLRRFPALLGGGVIYTVAIIVGLILLVVPGVFLGTALLFFYIAVLVEDKGPIASMQRSWELVRGHWWRTATLLATVTVVVAVLYLLLGIVIGLAVFFNGGAAPEPGLQMPWYVDFVVAPLLTGLLAPLGYALIMSIYGDLKLRREPAC